jgi:Lhr-like helicase
MHERFPRLAWVSFEDQVALKPQRSKALFEYYFDNLSMIPVEKQFLVIDESMDSSIGVLDEAFMAEYGKPGTKFIIRGSPWQIMHATEDKVYVRPVDDHTGSIPSWIGEEIPVPYEIAQELAEIRGFAEEKILLLYIRIWALMKEYIFRFAVWTFNLTLYDRIQIFRLFCNSWGKENPTGNLNKI